MSEIKNKEVFPLIKLLPNIVTLICLVIGLSAIRFALYEHWVKAVLFILTAGFLDGVDGRLARFLNSTSEMGAQLDSLADMVNFGVAPSLVIYMWLNSYSEVRGFDWALVLFFTVCMAIRLARFNAALGRKSNNQLLEKYFFKGVPAPCGAAMAMLPIVFFYQFGPDNFFSNPLTIIIYMFVLAIFVASTIPTISIKKIPIRNDYVYLTLMIFGLIIIGLITIPWLTLVTIGVIYALSIPVTTIFYFKIKNSL